MRPKADPTTWKSIALRSAPGSLGSWILAPRKDWATVKPLAMVSVVIQMSMPNLAISVSQTSLVRKCFEILPEKPKSPPMGCRTRCAIKGAR